MNAKQIVRYLSLVGKELEDMGMRESIELLLIGGGYVLTQVRGSRLTTMDVDIVWLHPELYTGSEVYWRFTMAVQLITSYGAP